MTRRSVTRRGVYGGLALTLCASALAHRAHTQAQKVSWNLREANGLGVHEKTQAQEHSTRERTGSQTSRGTVVPRLLQNNGDETLALQAFASP